MCNLGTGGLSLLPFFIFLFFFHAGIAAVVCFIIAVLLDGSCDTFSSGSKLLLVLVNGLSTQRAPRV